MKLYQLNNTVLILKNNPAQFLNGLTSNTIDEPQNAFLNIHGRIIVVFYQARIGDDEIWIVVPNGRIKPLLEHLDRYIKLSRIEVQRPGYSVYFNMEGNGGGLPAGQDKGRAGLPKDAVIIPLPKGGIVITERPLDAQASEEEFRVFRLHNKIPLQDTDFTDEFVLNVGSEGLVSFTKGCFLGQEPVSKVHNRSRPSWQLVVEYEDQCDGEAKAKMTSKALDPATNRVLGFVFKRNQVENND